MMARRFAADHAVTRRRLLANGAKAGAALAAGPRSWALGRRRRPGPGSRAAGDRIESDGGPAHSLPLPRGHGNHDGGELPDPRKPDHLLAAELPGLRRQPSQLQPECSAPGSGSDSVLPDQRHPRLERPGHRALPRSRTCRVTARNRGGRWPAPTPRKRFESGTYDTFIGTPTWFGFDAFGYLEGQAKGDLTSYGAIFDPANAGRATLLNEPITSVMKVATYLEGTGQAEFEGALNNLTKKDLRPASTS